MLYQYESTKDKNNYIVLKIFKNNKPIVNIKQRKKENVTKYKTSFYLFSHQSGTQHNYISSLYPSNPSLFNGHFDLEMNTLYSYDFRGKEYSLKLTSEGCEICEVVNG